MKKLLCLTILVVLCCSETALCVEIGGVTLPETYKVGNVDLVLNGCGLRTKFGFKVYAIGLYLEAKNSDSKSIIEADVPMTLIKKYRRTVPVNKINGVFFDSFATIVKAPKQDNYDETSDYGPLTKEIVAFMKSITERKATKKDTYFYVYTPGKGTDVYLNDSKSEANVLKATIPGLDFKKVLFAIWIGENPPVGNGLKDEMLGKK